MAPRAPRVDELPTLQAIGVAAGRRFAEVGLDDVATDPPLELGELEAWRAAGHAWVICDGDDPVGFVVVDVVDGCAHIEEVSVLPDHNGRGHGAALLDHVADWARRRHMPGVTLTTFSDVPWNRPYYERRGFRVLGPDELTPGLAARREAETARGLDPAQRVCMRRDP